VFNLLKVSPDSVPRAPHNFKRKEWDSFFWKNFVCVFFLRFPPPLSPAPLFLFPPSGPPSFLLFPVFRRNLSQRASMRKIGIKLRQLFSGKMALPTSPMPVRPLRFPFPVLPQGCRLFGNERVPRRRASARQVSRRSRLGEPPIFPPSTLLFRGFSGLVCRGLPPFTEIQLPHVEIAPRHPSFLPLHSLFP